MIFYKCWHFYNADSSISYFYFVSLEEDVLNYQEVLKSLGRTGSWQLGLWTLLAFLVLLDGLCQSLFEFTAFTPKFRCNIPFCEHPKNTTYLEQVSQNFPHYVIHGIPQEFLEAGDSCEYLGIAGMPDEIQEAAILNKVCTLDIHFRQIEIILKDSTAFFHQHIMFNQVI